MKKKNIKIEDITVDDILHWVMKYGDEKTAEIDRINFATYPYTSKYKNKGQDQGY